MQVQAATKSDIPAIMRVERMEGYARLIGRWEAERHAAGFAILQNIGSANRSVRLRRIAVENVGRDVGSLLLRSALQTCFEDLAANRVELFVFVDNQRAYRTYLKTGFVEEGILRDVHREADGTFRSSRLMSMLRREWTVRP